MSRAYRACKYCGGEPGGYVPSKCSDPNGHDFVVAGDRVCAICRHSPYDNLPCRPGHSHDFRYARELMSLREEH